MIYLFPESAPLNLERFKDIWRQVQSARADSAALLDEVARMVEAGNYYKALKLCGRLFRNAETAAPPAGGAAP